MSDWIGTCMKCGKEMRYNVPRLGPDGGFVHKDTGSLDCREEPCRHPAIDWTLESEIFKERQIDNVMVPVPQIKSKADHDNGQISLVSEIAGHIMEEVIATKAAHVRARLIELGWTPPEEPEQ